MYRFDENAGRLVPNSEPAKPGLWLPEVPLQFLNSWSDTWESLEQVAFYGKEFYLNHVTTADLKHIKVKYASDTQDPH